MGRRRGRNRGGRLGRRTLAALRPGSFVVERDGVVVIGTFTEVTGLGSETEVVNSASGRGTGKSAGRDAVVAPWQARRNELR